MTRRSSWSIGATAVLISVVVFVAAFRQRSGPNARQSGLFDSAQLLQDLRVLSADDMQGRRVDTAGGARARAYILDRFKASGIAPFGTTFEEPFTFTMGPSGHQAAVHGVNVVGRIDGVKRPQRYIVISAHYDHLGVENGVVYDGADDNASGAAALFSIATYVRAHRTANSIIVAAFDGEEEGLRGAQAFVKQPPVVAGAMGIDLNMDMIGRDPNDTLFVVGIHRQPALRPLVERVAASAPVKLLIGHDTPGEKEDWTDESDHYAFMQAHIPALYFGVEDFDHHHQPTDKFETMTFDFYVRAVETMIQAVKEFDAHLDAVGAGRVPAP